jgi:hypothetical protein
MALYLSAFADDAAYKLANGDQVTGKKALAEWRAKLNADRIKANSPPRRHWTSSVLVTPTPDGAKGRDYYFHIDVSAKPRVIYASGYHDDTFVKTADGWRIKLREDHPDPAP